MNVETYRRRRVWLEKPLVVREHSPALRPDSALAQLVRETRESGVEVVAWSIRGGRVQ